MLEIRFEPIVSVEHVSAAVEIAQITCFFLGEFHASDLSWDDDVLLASYVDRVRAGGDEEYAEYLSGEPVRGVQEAKEIMLAEMASILSDRFKALGSHSPFELGPADGQILRRKDLEEIDGAGTAYLWLSLFSLLDDDQHYLQAPEAQVKEFRSAFDKVFEVISCYAIAGRTEQRTWYVGKNRSTQDLLKFLQHVLRRAKSGKVKDFDDLDANQKKANDAGVDGIGLTLHGGALGMDAELILLQATIQKSNRRIKIMGQDQINRFKQFFLQNPKAAAKGALAIPYEGEAIDAADCAERNCIYITKNEILRYIGREPTNTPRSGTRGLESIMTSFNRPFCEAARLLTADGPLSVA